MVLSTFDQLERDDIATASPVCLQQSARLSLVTGVDDSTAVGSAITANSVTSVNVVAVDGFHSPMMPTQSMVDMLRHLGLDRRVQCGDRFVPQPPRVASPPTSGTKSFTALPDKLPTGSLIHEPLSGS